jgi:hypothetical protein
MDAISTYSEARNEYLKQLSTWIVPFMIQYYRNLWSEAKKVGGDRREMVIFQEKCAEVPKWNQDIIDTNIGKLLESCRCDYLEELMAAVFIAHTKVLISIRVSSKHKKLQITLPKLDHFLHRVFSECARSFWKSPFLFLDDQKPIEMQKNLIQAEALCSESIASAVRSLLPIKNILSEYLSDDALLGEATVEDSEEIKPAEVPKPKTESNTVSNAEITQELVPEKEVESVVQPVLAPEQEQVVEPEPEQLQETVPESVAETVKEPVKGGSITTNQIEPEEIVIDTNSVQFSDYDNVFDQHSEQVGTFSFNPKNNDDVTPQLHIVDDIGTALNADDLTTNLEASGIASADLTTNSVPSGIMTADEILD